MDPDPFSSILLSINAAFGISDLITFQAPSLGSIIAFIVAIFALFLSAFVSGSEIAYFSLTPKEIAATDDINKRDIITRLLQRPERLLASILISNNLVNVSIVIMCNYIMNQIFVFQNQVFNFIFQSVILTFIILLFGEILPKLYATNNNLKFALFASSGVSFMCKLCSPLSRVMEKSTFIVNKIVTKHNDEISKEELSHALELSDVETDGEKELLEGILKFGGTTVVEIMRPRVDIEDISYDTDFETVINTAISTGYSRLPVYKDNRDNIKGILYAKDLLPYIGKRDNNFQWQQLLREAYFVPETRMIDDLLEDFRKMQIHMAIIVDEFGGTQGIVTLEDVLEEIVGDINDEYDTEEKLYQKIDENTYIFEGKTLLGDFCEVTETDEEDFESASEDTESLAGLLLSIKGDFPKIQENIIFKNYQFTPLELEKHRISKVKVVIFPKTNNNK